MHGGNFDGHELGHVKSVASTLECGIWVLQQWRSFYVNCRASYVPWICLFWIVNVICYFIIIFSMSLISFFERIEKLFSPRIREQIVPHLRGVTVYFQPLPSLNFNKVLPFYRHIRYFWPWSDVFPWRCGNSWWTFSTRQGGHPSQSKLSRCLISSYQLLA